MSVHWGSFILGVVATVICGALVAGIIGFLNGGGDDLF